MEERLTAILSDLEGFAYEEIAHISETTHATVQSRLSNARSQLRVVLLAPPELVVAQNHLDSRNMCEDD